MKDADENRESDRKFHELVDVRNKADNLIHATTKSLQELKDEVSAEEKSSIESALEALKEAMKSDDKAAIEAKVQALTEVSGKMAQRVYAKKGGGEAGATPSNGAAGPQEAPEEKKSDNVVDAEFEEVKDKKEEK